jgi:hypothetical protein
MKSCRQVTQMMSESQERALTCGECMTLFFHTMMCSACRQFGKQMPLLRELSRLYSKGESVKGESAKGESVKGESVKGESAKGEGSTGGGPESLEQRGRNNDSAS